MPKLGMHAGSDLSTSQYDTFTTWLGQQCLTRNTFAGYQASTTASSWAQIASPSVLSTSASWINRGSQYQEVIAVAMCPMPTSINSGRPSSSGVTLAQVAANTNGTDTYWTQLGQNIAAKIPSAKQSQLVLRLGWEMNGDWYQWGFGSANSSWNTITDFLNAYKRIVPLIRANAPNVKFEWCPAAGRDISGGLQAAYPDGNASDGKPYVDIIGIDAYDSYDTGGWLSLLNGGGGVISGGLSGFRTFAQGKGKPEAYTEWSCVSDAVHGHTDNPLYVAAMYCWFNAPGANVDHQCYWNTSSGGPNAAIQGASGAPTYTGSISGTTLTLTNIPSQALPGLNHYLFTTDPVHNVQIVPGTRITAGSGTSFTVNNSQTVPSQSINIIPVPKAAQMYRTLFSKNPSVSVIGSTLSNGRLVPATPIPNNYAVVFDGTNFNVAVHP